MQHSPAKTAKVRKTRVQQGGKPDSSTTTPSTLGSVDSSHVSGMLVLYTLTDSSNLRPYNWCQLVRTSAVPMLRRVVDEKLLWLLNELT